MNFSNKEPNILLIITDTQRCDTLSFMGNPHAVSPYLNRLAEEGISFKQAHTSSPVCMPARCSLLTGVHTPIHGCIENSFRRKQDLTVLPDLLKEQGYTNIMVGKTHFGPIPESFDIQHITYEKFLAVEDEYTEHLKRHGYDRATHHRHPTPIPDDVYMEAYLVDHTIQEIKKVTANGKTPFFAIRNDLLSALLSWCAEIGDLQHMIEGKARLVGPVAARARAHVDTIQGTDAEQRLNERAERIDEKNEKD